MTDKTGGLRDELEKAWFEGLNTASMRVEFIRGAKWMAEKIAQYHINRYEYTGEATALEIRQLAKELQ